MTAAQLVLAALVVAFLAAGTVLLVTEHSFAGGFLVGLAVFGFLIHLGMVAADSTQRRS